MEKAQETPQETALLPRLLVVEDNEIAARVGQIILETLHYQVDVAGNAEEAMSLLRQHTYQLIFMDIGLPGMDGWQLARWLRTALPQPHNQTPIIVLSADEDSCQPSDGSLALINEAIVKPLTRMKAMELLHKFTQPVSLEQRMAQLNQSLPSSSVALETLPVIDLAEAQKFLGTDPLVFKPLLHYFLSHVAEQITAIDQAFVAQQWSEVAAMAHKLHGASGYYGARQLQVICKQLHDVPSDAAASARLYQQWRYAAEQILAYQLA